jgi:hypothetical protein
LRGVGIDRDEYKYIDRARKCQSERARASV